MRRLGRVIGALYPEALISGTGWEADWAVSQREAFLKSSSFFFSAAALVYVAHFVLYDIPMGLDPIEGWLVFRLAAAGSCLLVVLYNRSAIAQGRFYKLPAAVMCLILCFSQARVTVLHAEAPFFFCFVFVFLAVIVLRMNALFSSLFASLCLVVQLPSLLEASIGAQLLASGGVVTVLACTVLRVSYLSEVQNYLLSRERDASNRAVIELSQEFANRLRSFIPKVIGNRLQDAVSKDGMSILEASIEVLRPKKVNIVCLFSDIRGFTQGSKNLDSFVEKSALPEIKACSEAIENFEGIPRKIGDLVFAYFDDSEMRLNIVRAVLSGLTISRLNRDLNETSALESVDRYILISSGEAIVGNVGGVDSSVEITALGTSVNYLARLDEASKHPGLVGQLQSGDVVLSESAATVLIDAGVEVDLRLISLAEYGVEIRDFPDANCIYTLVPSIENLELLHDAYGRLMGPHSRSLNGLEVGGDHFTKVA